MASLLLAECGIWKKSGDLDQDSQTPAWIIQCSLPMEDWGVLRVNAEGGQDNINIISGQICPYLCGDGFVAASTFSHRCQGAQVVARIQRTSPYMFRVRSVWASFWAVHSHASRSRSGSYSSYAFIGVTIYVWHCAKSEGAGQGLNAWGGLANSSTVGSLGMNSKVNDTTV